MKRYYIILVMLLVLIALPFIGWQLESPKELSVAVIDHTVPNETYREHQGIHWALNHLKVLNSEGEAFELDSDYYGTVPNEAAKSYSVRDLPTDYSAYDFVYLADTYGVFEDDVPWEGDLRQGERSMKLYGGLTDQEWQAMRHRFDSTSQSTFVAEFNSFASPTALDVQQAVTNYLGIAWTGWVGRYFTELDLALNLELPQWLVTEYGDDWAYSGPGILFVNDFTQEIFVLEQAEHLTAEGVNLTYTEAGQAFFGLENSTAYTYWFDIIKAQDQTDVLAKYQFNVTEAGAELLAEHQIPLTSAAVTRRVMSTHTSYYFAGDYNDTTDLPMIYQLKGLATFNRWQANLTDGEFYWSAFMPMMATIIGQAQEDVSESQVGITQTTSNPGQLDNETDDTEEVTYRFRVTGPQFEVLKDGEWEAMTIKGVNMGMANPGHFPGEAGITEDEYARWFEMIGEMNANTIRIYTIHPPGFYRALKAYNDSHPESPLYLFHGVWMDEEGMVATQNVMDEDNLAAFQAEIRRIVDLTHGNLVIEPRPGHASGIYDADISDYIIGWMIGTEWDPHVVVGTNEANAGIGEYMGKYFATEGASPFEHFLAAQMDLMMSYELDNYQEQRPMSFTNWVTTDLLDHPTESVRDEDMVSVNPNVIDLVGVAQETGQFASYHVYPYYPDFLNYTERYNSYIDHRGNPNNYAGYLKDLHEAHEMPVLIAEFGIPASRGRTHENPFGRHQGGVSEEAQGLMVAAMYEEIVEEGMLGGLVFTWQDEWFKRTWNTMDYDNPDQRPFWSNAQTNEQQFGLLSFDRHKIRVNGELSDWTEREPLYQAQAEAEVPIRGLWLDHDERYLYIRLDYDPAATGSPVLTLDTVPEQGNQAIEGIEGASLSDGAEFMVDLSDEARVLVDDYYDFYTIQYGLGLGLLREVETPEKNSGRFVPIQFALNKEYYVVDKDLTLPFTAYETGLLTEGNGDPDSPDYNSMADYYVDRKAGVIELRLPWLLLSARDPSQKEFQGDLMADGLEASVLIDAMNIVALWQENQVVVEQLPSVSYTWDNWTMPVSQERLKQSYYILQETFKRYE